MSFQRTCVQFQHTFRCLTTIHSFSFRMPSSGLLRYCTHVEHTQTSRHIQMLPLWYSPHRVSDASSQLLSMWEMMVALCFGWKWQPQCDGMWVAVPHQPPTTASISHHDIVHRKIRFSHKMPMAAPLGKLYSRHSCACLRLQKPRDVLYQEELLSSTSTAREHRLLRLWFPEGDTEKERHLKHFTGKTAPCTVPLHVLL